MRGRAFSRLLLVATLLWPSAVTASTAGASPAPMRLSVGAPVRSKSGTVYRITVRSTGAPVLAVLPADVHLGELVVNGVSIQKAGRDASVGIQPFGHGVAALQLSHLSPQDTVEIRESGRGGPPKIATDPDTLANAFDSGLGSGIFYGILITIVLFLIVAAFTMKEPTLLWHILWIATVFAIELARDNLMPLSQTATEHTLPIGNVVAQAGFAGFVITYLRLRTAAPRLLWLLVVTTFVSVAMPAVVSAITRQPPSIMAIYVPDAVSGALALAIAVIRRRAGFLPASYLAVGLIGNFLFFALRPLRAATGIESPFLDRWTLEFLSVFDFLVFALGLAYRARFARREHEVIERELVQASLVAGQDPLTGLLNRRGFEGWMRGLGRSEGTVLFIDIDGFKAINDLGGHSAGDDTLTVVARIIRHSVREQDAVCRFGGDEFVAMLVGCNDPDVTAGIVSRISSAVGFLLPLGAQSETRIGVSIGSAQVNRLMPFEEALKAADADAYRNKAEHHAKYRQLRRQRVTAS